MGMDRFIEWDGCAFKSTTRNTITGITPTTTSALPQRCACWLYFLGRNSRFGKAYMLCVDEAWNEEGAVV